MTSFLNSLLNIKARKSNVLLNTVH